MSIFTLVDMEVGMFNDSKSDLYANSNITLNGGNVIPLSAS